jgi:hypothetical protein
VASPWGQVLIDRRYDMPDFILIKLITNVLQNKFKKTAQQTTTLKHEAKVQSKDQPSWLVY